MPAVVCVGFATLDTILVVQERPPEDGRIVASDHVVAGGGPAATAAVTLARLGVPSAFVGSVGDDEAGSRIVDGLIGEGVDVSGLTTARGARSPQSVILVNGSKRSIVHYPGTAAIEPNERALALIAGADWIHADHVGYRCVPRDGRLSLDGGNRIEGLDLAGVRLYAPTEERLAEQFGSGRAAIEAGAALVVATRGASGSVAYLADGSLVEVAAEATEVKSTLGAGDVFHGALLAAFVRDEPVESALRLANRCAALSCRAVDGRSAIPTASEVLT